MSQIEELQGRITAAMARIGAGAGALAEQAAKSGGNGGAALADLEAALEEEKLANAQLGERVKTLKARHEEEIETLRAELDQSGALGALKDEVEKLKAENAAQKADLDEAAKAEDLTAEIDRLKSEVETLKAELEAASKAEAQQTEIGRLKREAEDQEDSLARLDMEIQRLREANDRLRDTNEELRKANADGVAEPKLINRAMLAEIEGLRAARAADAAEAGAVLKKLDLLLANAQNLPEGEED